MVRLATLRALVQGSAGAARQWAQPARVAAWDRIRVADFEANLGSEIGGGTAKKLKLKLKLRSEEGARLSSNFWNRNGVGHEISVAIDRIRRSWEETED